MKNTDQWLKSLQALSAVLPRDTPALARMHGLVTTATDKLIALQRMELEWDRDQDRMMRSLLSPEDFRRMEEKMRRDEATMERLMSEVDCLAQELGRETEDVRKAQEN